MTQAELLEILEPALVSSDIDLRRHAMRLSALVSLHYFIFMVLKRDRLRDLQKMICSSLESEDLHLVLELPMGHFKTTLATEGLAIWWALPFNETDHASLVELGCGPEWMRWMRKCHSADARTLIVHEVEALSIKFGEYVDSHYHDNDLFRYLFPEILPDGSSTWNAHTKIQKRPSSNSEGTFEYRGVGQSLQSLHVTGIIEDDLVGKAAQDSMRLGDNRVMESTISYHRKVSTRFDPAHFTKTGLGRQIVIGNRWGHNDLNAWIRANQPEFQIETHSAEGGCCELHQAGKPIFPEEYSPARLEKLRNTLGSYDYAHFYLNSSVLPEECIFRPEWLKHYRFKPSRPALPLEDPRNELMLEHEVYNAQVVEDMNVGVLFTRMIVDPNHRGKRGRARHSIEVVGYDTETDRIYLLDVWAQASGYSEVVDMMYKVAERWGLRELWMDTNGAEYLKFYMDQKNLTVSKPLTVNELPTDYGAHAKEKRIEALEPIFKNGQFWCHRSHTPFMDEYRAYPASATVDCLDTLGYAPRIFEVMRRREMHQWLRDQQHQFIDRVVGPAGY